MNNEEKILSILEQQSKTLEQHTELLKQHTELLKQHSEILADMQDRLVRVEVTQENVVLPSLTALAEGINRVNDRLIPRSEIDAMKDEIALLREVVRMHTSQLNELKSAG